MKHSLVSILVIAPKARFAGLHIETRQTPSDYRVFSWHFQLFLVFYEEDSPQKGKRPL
ncbi:MAG: hypothetical protein ACJAXQ_000945 [Parvibaculaceae bacterium]|jgi:hypothetical protein|tara:strand:- start:221 stop:394 length:174 start_codon:yes stop_codon:yes gene_type:complete